jgi:hypothetical protein
MRDETRATAIIGAFVTFNWFMAWILIGFFRDNGNAVFMGFFGAGAIAGFTATIATLLDAK